MRHFIFLVFSGSVDGGVIGSGIVMVRTGFQLSGEVRFFLVADVTVDVKRIERFPSVMRRSFFLSCDLSIGGTVIVPGVESIGKNGRNTACDIRIENKFGALLNGFRSEISAIGIGSELRSLPVTACATADGFPQTPPPSAPPRAGR